MVRFVLLLIPLSILTFIDFLFIIFYSRKNPYGEFNNKLMRSWCWLILKICGIELEYEGLDNVINDRSSIVLANHQSAFDIPVLGYLLPATVRFMAKKELFRFPVFGQAMKGAGILKIDRQNRIKAIESIKQTIKLLKENVIAIIGFPEGTRTPDGEVKQFKKGLFIMAIDAGHPIVPVSISGADKRAKKHSIHIKPGKIRVVIHPPVEVTGYNNENREHLMKTVRDVIISGVDPNFGGES